MFKQQINNVKNTYSYQPRQYFKLKTQGNQDTYQKLSTFRNRDTLIYNEKNLDYKNNKFRHHMKTQINDETYPQKNTQIEFIRKRMNESNQKKFESNKKPENIFKVNQSLHYPNPFFIQSKYNQNNIKQYNTIQQNNTINQQNKYKQETNLIKQKHNQEMRQLILRYEERQKLLLMQVDNQKYKQSYNEQEIQTLKKHINLLTDDIGLCKVQYKKLKQTFLKDIEIIQQKNQLKIHQYELQLQSLQGNYDRINSEYESLEQDYKNLINQIQKINEQFNQVSQQLQIRQKQFSKLKNQKQDQSGDLGFKEDIIKKLQLKINNLTTQLQNLSYQNQSLKNQISEGENLNQKLQNHYNDLKAYEQKTKIIKQQNQLYKNQNLVLNQQNVYIHQKYQELEHNYLILLKSIKQTQSIENLQKNFNRRSAQKYSYVNKIPEIDGLKQNNQSFGFYDPSQIQTRIRQPVKLVSKIKQKQRLNQSILKRCKHILRPR